MGPSGILTLMISYSLYVSLPYCKPDCRLCRPTHMISPGLEEEYAAAVVQEIKEWRQMAGKEVPVQSVYIGGDCPPRISIPHLTVLLRAIRANFGLMPQAEITLEILPGREPQGGFQRFGELGINRINLEGYGIYAEEVNILGRSYRYQDLSRTVSNIRKAGIENMNLDLMFGIPGQTVGHWRKVVEAALSFKPEHLSAYSFYPEEGSLMRTWMEKGLLASCEPEKRVAMYKLLDQRLQQAGYDHYELSSWAKSGYACQHNLRYWRSNPYLGFGADAHGYVDGRRIQTISSPSRYIQALEGDKPSADFPGTSASLPHQDLSRETHMLEFVFMGLHLIREGVSRRRFYERFQVELEPFVVDAIHPFLEEGLLEWTDKRLRFTAQGVERASLVLRRLIEEGSR